MDFSVGHGLSVLICFVFHVFYLSSSKPFKINIWCTLKLLLCTINWKDIICSLRGPTAPHSAKFSSWQQQLRKLNCAEVKFRCWISNLFWRGHNVRHREFAWFILQLVSRNQEGIEIRSLKELSNWTDILWKDATEAEWSSLIYLWHDKCLVCE